MTNRLKLILLLPLLLTLAGKAQQVIPLYEGLPPGSLPVEDIETAERSTSGNKRLFVTNVTRPTLTVYLPEKPAASGTAIIICPGGGYSRLSIEDGGYEAAKVFADAGIAAFVLKYRTQRAGAYTDYRTAPQADLKQAMEIVYRNAGAWNIDTSRLGILGFSAGGHLTAMAATFPGQRKPAFTLLIYPVISFMDSLTSPTSGSRGNLLGKRISEEDKISYSPELHISSTTPPSFIVHAKDDSTSLAGNSIAYYSGLKSRQIPAELLLYEKGGHGFALYNKAEKKYWFPAAVKWLSQQGIYKK